MALRRSALFAALVLMSGTALAQSPYPPPGYPPPPSASAPPQAAYPPPQAPASLYQTAQLDSMLAPIALYPDPLLTEILTAATYPYEVDAAAQWRASPQAAGLVDGALDAALEAYDWDPSIKSLAAFPNVLAMMDQHLDWTEALGNAFLAQQADVMDSIQRLRHQALATGTLVSTPYMTVSENGPYITIEPANPQYVYVPVYNPVTVYGAWPYPSYPPDYWGPPPGLSAYYAMGALGFSIGIPIVAALWDWGDWDWRGHDVHINPGRFNAINAGHPAMQGTTWQHDASHRRGVPYRGAAVQQRYQPPVAGSATSRQPYRFYGAAPGAAAASRAPAASMARREVPRAAPVQGARSAPAVPRTESPPTAFEGVERGREAATEAARGAASRAAMARAAPAPRAAPARRAAPAPRGGGSKPGPSERRQ